MVCNINTLWATKKEPPCTVEHLNFTR